MMPSSSTEEKPSYSYVVATSRSAYRQPLSEASSTPTSAESDSEMIGRKSSLSDLIHLETERFKVDRRKMEKLLTTPSEVEGVSSAEAYFEKIMNMTNTFITWPRNLKLNGKSRKDPFLRIDGRQIDINWAKGLIMSTLATRGPLLKMKIAISNTDHPHVIGRGGNTVNRIMEETKTHVHFPDINRRNVLEKCNQVSIYGHFEGLDPARCLLRSASPLIFSFQLSAGRAVPKHDTPFIKDLEFDFNVKVIFLSTPSPHYILVLVKGTENEPNKVKEAVQILLKSTCGSTAASTLVTIQLGISPHLYDFVRGEENENIVSIMEKTRTLIKFPEPSEIGQNSQVNICGTVNGVHEAKTQLIECLPIELIFDIEDQGNTADIMTLGPMFGVSISMHPKQKDNSITVTIKAAEKFARHIYAAREEILDMQVSTAPEPETPKAYLLQEPLYRRTLENNMNSDHIQYESIANSIWAPIDPNAQSSFLQVLPVTAPISDSIWNNVSNNFLSNSPLEQEEPEPEPARAILSPDSTDSSEAAYHDGRRSSDWVMMKPIEGAVSEDEDQHFECDLDSADKEVAYIFMSAAQSPSPVFEAAPGADVYNRW